MFDKIKNNQIQKEPPFVPTGTTKGESSSAKATEGEPSSVPTGTTKGEPEDIFAGAESAIIQPKGERQKDNFDFEFEEKKPAKIKKLIMIVAGLLLVAGLAYGGYFGWTKYQQSTAFKKEAQKAENLINNQQEESKTENIIINKDADADGLSDQEEIKLGTDINKIDTDNDGLSDREEANVYKTNPLNADTDGDGFSDGQEVKSNYNPNDPAKGAKLMDLQKEIEKLKQ